MDNDDPTADERAAAERIALLSAQVYTEDIARRRLVVGEIFDLCYKLGSRARAALPALLHCLSDRDDKVGESALWSLVWCEPESIDPLIDCLANPDATTRRRACDALGNIGDAASSARDALRRLLTDAAEEVRLRAAWALGLVHDTSDRTITALFAWGRSGSIAERRAAYHALGNIGTALIDPRPLRTYQQQVLDTLDDDDEDVRWSACYVLASLRPDVPLHVELLILRLADSSSRVRALAIRQLKELAPTTDLAEHVASMCEVVRGSGSEAEDMCKVLAMVGPKAKSAVPYLTEALRAENGSLVIAAATALWKIDRQIVESLPALARLFDEHGESVCDAICEIGPAAAPLIHEVIGALQTEDWDLQWAAADALGALSSSDPQVLAALVASLGHASAIVRTAAARALAQIGPPAVPALIEILQGQADVRCECAADALGRMGHRAIEATEALRSRLRSAPPGIASWCAIALGKVTGDAAVAPMLMDLVARAEQPNIRREAAVGLKAIGPPAICATDVLIAALDDDDANVRTAVEEALAAVRAQSH
jgi:HEAT repeat protein